MSDFDDGGVDDFDFVFDDAPLRDGEFAALRARRQAPNPQPSCAATANYLRAVVRKCFASPSAQWAAASGGASLDELLPDVADDVAATLLRANAAGGGESDAPSPGFVQLRRVHAIGGASTRSAMRLPVLTAVRVACVLQWLAWRRCGVRIPASLLFAWCVSSAVAPNSAGTGGGGGAVTNPAAALAMMRRLWVREATVVRCALGEAERRGPTCLLVPLARTGHVVDLYFDARHPARAALHEAYAQLLLCGSGSDDDDEARNAWLSLVWGMAQRFAGQLERAFERGAAFGAPELLAAPLPLLACICVCCAARERVPLATPDERAQSTIGTLLRRLILFCCYQPAADQAQRLLQVCSRIAFVVPQPLVDKECKRGRDSGGGVGGAAVAATATATRNQCARCGAAFARARELRRHLDRGSCVAAAAAPLPPLVVGNAGDVLRAVRVPTLADRSGMSLQELLAALPAAAAAMEAGRAALAPRFGRVPATGSNDAAMPAAASFVEDCGDCELCIDGDLTEAQCAEFLRSEPDRKAMEEVLA